MFWNFCCCMKNKHELNSTGEAVYSNIGKQLFFTDECLNKHILFLAPESQNIPISVISSNSNNNTTIEPTSDFQKRTRISSTSSTFSNNSFYSIKSSVSRGDGDFYSICSADSFKST